jgi:hypothetical protein
MDLDMTEPTLQKGMGFCFWPYDRGLTPKRKNEWTNHAIAWYKHAI